MTDDEAFIRMIVANPGDEAPRLIYADWLEEREDDRGEYLRLEMQLAQWFQDNRLDDKTLFEWLDRNFHGSQMVMSIPPLWIARISRPPMGVCCDRITFADHRPDRVRPVLTKECLFDLSRRLDIYFPYDYKAFLLNYNGGVPSLSDFEIPDTLRFSLNHFHTVWSVDGSEVQEEYDLVACYQRLLEVVHRDRDWAKQQVEIARSDDESNIGLCLNLDSSWGSPVFLRYPPTDPMAGFRDVAHWKYSFAEFMYLFDSPGSGSLLLPKSDEMLTEQ